MSAGGARGSLVSLAGRPGRRGGGRAAEEQPSKQRSDRSGEPRLACFSVFLSLPKRRVGNRHPPPLPWCRATRRKSCQPLRGHRRRRIARNQIVSTGDTFRARELGEISSSTNDGRTSRISVTFNYLYLRTGERVLPCVLSAAAE